MAATDFLWASYPIPGGDIPGKNTDGTSAFVFGDALQLDGTNVIGASQPAIGVKSGALQSSFFGFAVESAPLNSITRIRVFGIAVATASAAITAGAIVGCAANRQVVTYTAAHQQVGYACSTTALAADPMLVLIDRASNA